MAAGVSIVMQLVITGQEQFNGYFIIENSNCNYFEGMVEFSDITIFSDAEVWADILKNKITAQKAFMIGQLKVRGNFVILTKFEQLFKIN